MPSVWCHVFHMVDNINVLQGVEISVLSHHYSYFNFSILIYNFVQYFCLNVCS